MPAGTTDRSAAPDVENGKEKDWNGSEVNGKHADDQAEEGQQRVLTRSLEGRHMQMIAFGGSIGAGLFVGSGGALQRGGPASLLIGWGVIGIMVLCTIFALAELAVTYPVNGAYFHYSVRFLSPSWGFAMGWLYSISWLLTLPNELSAAGITISYWRPDLHVSIWVATFLIALALVQLFGVRGYGEVEFILAVIKITAIVGFIILGIIIDCGGVPTDNRGYIGGRYFHDPGPFRHGFKGFCSVFVTAAFSFSGTELVGLAAAESADPVKALPKASRQVFWRITLFYMISLLIIGLLVPSNDERLLQASGANTVASPFVIAIEDAGIRGLPSVMNAVITLAVLSVGNSAIYGSTRTFHAMAEIGMAPRFLSYIDKKGRPLWTTVLAFIIGLIGFVGEASSAQTVFTWLTATSGLSVFFAFGSILLSHVRFRYAWKAQGRALDELAWTSPLGVTGSIFGFVLVILAMAATFYVSLFPLEEKPSAELFFQGYLALPLVIFFYVFYKVWKREREFYVKVAEIDLDDGRRIFEKDPNQVRIPIYKKIYNFFS